MGRKTQSFVVRAYLASDAADAEREAFMSLLSSPGAGMLILPMHGAKLANCTEVRTSGEKNKLGYIGFDLRFVEAMTSAAASIVSAFARIAFTVAGQLASLIPATIGATLPGQAVPQSGAIPRAGGILLSAATIAADLGALAPTSAGTDPVDVDLRVIRSAINRATTLSAVSDQVAVVAGFIHAHAAVAEATEMQSAGLAMSAAILSAIPATASPALANEQRLGKRIAQSLGLLLVSEAAAAAASRSFNSRTQANETRSAIIAAFDAALASAVDVAEPVALAAREAVTAAIRHIDETAGDLAPLVRIDAPRSLPSTALAWALYRDPSRAPELVAAARTGTSLFMPTTLIASAR
jgi:hypothetical protein